MKAVIDSIVGEKVVLLVGENEKEYHLPIHQLPSSIKEGEIVEVQINEDDLLTILSINPSDHEQTKKRISNKLSQLRQRKNSQFKQ